MTAKKKTTPPATNTRLNIAAILCNGLIASKRMDNYLQAAETALAYADALIMKEADTAKKEGAS